MGNDNSKTAIENQQLLLQLQQQALSNTRYPPNQTQYYNQQQHTQYNPQMQQNHRNANLPVISPAELQQRVMHPTMGSSQVSDDGGTKPRTLMDILHNKKLMAEVEKNPQTKRKFLERLLNEHQHIMTSTQVSRINQMLEGLPPANNNYQPREQQYASVRNNDPGAVTGAIGWNEGTTRRDLASRELERTQQLDSIDALTKHYKTEAEREEAEFKLEEERRRKEFYEKQRQRRSQYQNKLTELEQNNVDALKVFNLKPKYTLEELKKAFRKKALIYHPDKPTGNEEQFQLITKCFMLLLEKYKNRESDKQFSDLKQGSKAYLEDQNSSRQAYSSSSGSDGVVQKDKFDVKLFNKIYEENKLWDSNDDGHGSWFSSNETENQPDELFGKKFNISVFNSAFEEYKERLNPNAGAVEKYHEPNELVSCNTGFTEIELSAKKIDDFSKPLPVGASGGKELAFTDLKVAYTSRGAFIDPNKVEYKSYQSIDELKRDRGNVRFDMTPEEQRIYNMKQRQKQEEEERRQYLVQERDNIAASSYSKIHQKMLGYKGSAPS